jgi:hypothetical protein
MGIMEAELQKDGDNGSRASVGYIGSRASKEVAPGRTWILWDHLPEVE